MPSNIGRRLNTMYETSFAAGDIATSFLAVEIETSWDRALKIYGIDAWLAFATAADQALLVQQRLTIFRGLRLKDNVSLASQATADYERTWGQIEKGISLRLDFTNPILLPAGHVYTFAQYPPDLSGALAGIVGAGLTIRGEHVAVRRVEAVREYEDGGELTGGVR